MLIFLIIVAIILILYVSIKIRINRFLKENFNMGSIKELIKETNLEEETREKTLYGMENIYEPILAKDFKELNLSELKSSVEENIIACYNCLNNKSVKDNEFKSENITTWIKEKIESMNGTDQYSNVKIHRTVLNKYKKNSSIATLTFQTSYEYKFNGKLTQKRMQTEFVYIIDADKVDGNAIGLNCPNCGAPIKSLGNKSCSYCGAGVIDITKRVWILDNIKEI